jgi:hypothetical protein
VSKEQPAVVIITIVNNPASGVSAAVLSELMSTWFNKHIGEFNHVFAALELSPIVSQSDKFTWMKPTATSYAVTDKGTLETSVFGVLTMVQKNDPSTNHQVSPAIRAATRRRERTQDFSSAARCFSGTCSCPARNRQRCAGCESDRQRRPSIRIRRMVWGKFMLDNNKRATLWNAANFAAQSIKEHCRKS